MPSRSAQTSPDWTARLEGDAAVRIKRVEKRFADITAGSSMVVVTPRILDQVVSTLPAGAVTPLRQLRGLLAEQYGAAYACPVTTGLALRVVAEAAYAKLKGGADAASVTPFWRPVDPESELAGKLACGRRFLRERIARERVAAA